MVDAHGLEERRRALEESFFAKKNAELLEGIRAKMAEEKARAQLAQDLGITDESLVAGLHGVGIKSESLAALSLVPLVAVAWADGTLDTDERKAILNAAHEKGISEGTASQAVLASWLQSPPPDDLVDCWANYVAGLKAHLSPAEHRRLGEDLIGRAREVAKAAGGVLGIGAISDAEEAVLTKMKQAFA